ncbi:MAG TPA: EamA family transporter [Gemmatimonadaceae bacterium]|nr:EamA family transporter [Gemmatimonadaceae bacterium]
MNTPFPKSSQRIRIIGYACALGAGAIWGTTGPLSTALYAEGAAISAVGFWRLLLAVLGFTIYGLLARDLFRIDRRGIWLIMVLGGALVALFEVPFQYAIAGLGVAPAVALLYTAPVTVAIAGHFILKEKLTALRIALAAGVMIGVWLTVHGEAADQAQPTASRLVGIFGGLIAAGSYAATAILARYVVPRYGSKKMLYWELVGGLIFLAILLPAFGQSPKPPLNIAGWVYVAALGIGAVVAANFLFFGAMKRIDAAPASVAASVEPLVGALLSLLLFNQQLRWFGWLGLLMVVGGVAGGYAEEAKAVADSALEDLVA